MDIYRRHFRRTVFWYRTQLWNEKKIMQTPPLYYFFQMYAPTKCRASGLMNFHSANDDWALLNKFLRKYPESSLSTTYMTMEPEMYSTAPHHPGERFVTRQKYFMSEGYTEAKAFELVEKEMSESLQEEKYERAMIEGIATSNRARSLMSLYEQSAEYEARQKIDRLNREIPDFIRSQKKWEEEINDILDSKTVSESKDTKNTYEPVSYLIANSMKDKGDMFKSNKVVQNEFLLRAEKLMEFYHSFAHIKDGISMMNDKDIVLKANESPKKLKDSMKQFLKKIEKMNIKLNPKGDIDYSDITDKMLLNFIKKNERQIKVCLMYKDLEFEFPHKVHLSELKANIINDINYEEDKFRDFEQKQVQDKRVALEEELRRRIMTYERYFELPLNCEADKVDASIEEVRKKNLSIKKAYSFDEWVKIKSAENLFDQDLVKEQYHYFETSSEKEERIRRLWIDSKSTRIEASIDIPSNEEVSQLNSEIVQHIRILRKRIDQDLLNNYKHPVFGSNYRQYDINEFMIDSDVEFEKIKKFLSNNPKLIQTDKEIGDDYLKLMKKLRRKKMIEKSISRFGDEHIDDYYLVEEVESKEKFEEEMEVSSRKYIDMKENLLYDKISRELDSQKPDSVEGSIETRSKANMIDEEALEKKKIETIKERIMTNFKSALQKSDNTIELDKKKPAVKQGTGKRRAVSSEIGKKNPVKGNKNKV